jgi:hypothetical protein
VVGQRIIATIAALSRRSYNWNGERGLPLRQDVRGFIDAIMLASEPNPIEVAEFHGARCVRVGLTTEGGVEIVIASHCGEGRGVVLDIPCAGVVRWMQSCDEKNFIDGTILFSEGAEIAKDPASDELYDVIVWAAEPPSGGVE